MRKYFRYEDECVECSMYPMDGAICRAIHLRRDVGWFPYSNRLGSENLYHFDLWTGSNGVDGGGAISKAPSSTCPWGGHYKGILLLLTFASEVSLRKPLYDVGWPCSKNDDCSEP